MQLVVDGILTNYQILGDKQQTLLILHGWQRSLQEWLPIAQTLSKTYKVVLLDLPGFGKTSTPGKMYTIYDYATFIKQFLDKLNVKKVTVLGHSFGGRLGIILASKTDRIENLVLVDAAGVEKRTLMAKIKITFFKFAKQFLPKKLTEKLRNKLGSRDYRSAGAMRDIFVKVVNEDLSALLPKIKVPTLIIWGNKDTEVEEWKTKKMKQFIPKSTLRVVWGADHSPHLEKPSVFMDILKEYLD